MIVFDFREDAVRRFGLTQDQSKDPEFHLLSYALLRRLERARDFRDHVVYNYYKTVLLFNELLASFFYAGSNDVLRQRRFEQLDVLCQGDVTTQWNRDRVTGLFEGLSQSHSLPQEHIFDKLIAHLMHLDLETTYAATDITDVEISSDEEDAWCLSALSPSNGG